MHFKILSHYVPHHFLPFSWKNSASLLTINKSVKSLWVLLSLLLICNLKSLARNFWWKKHAQKTPSFVFFWSGSFKPRSFISTWQDFSLKKLSDQLCCHRSCRVMLMVSDFSHLQRPLAKPNRNLGGKSWLKFISSHLGCLVRKKTWNPTWNQ